jgi:HK97 family phage portal protein
MIAMEKRNNKMPTRKKEFPAQKIEIEAAGVISSDLGIQTPEPFENLIEAFGVHTWVYSCANLIANAFSMIEFLPYIESNDGSWEVNEKHPFFKILSKPNPSMSGMEFRRILSLSSKLTGNAFIICEPDATRTPLELWPLQPHKVTVKSDSKNFVSGYVYSVNGHSQDFSAERIIHIREATPTNLQYGQGSLTAVKNAVTADLFADAWNRYFFANSTRPDAILESPTALSSEDQKRALAAWKKAYEGPKNRGKIAVLGGLKYIEVNRLHKDMEFVNLRKMLREEVLAAFGVPQSMVGILDQANYSNMKEQTKVFWTQTMIPEIRKFESIMTLRATQITGDDKTIIQADLSKVEALREDEASRASVAQIYVNMGVPLGQVVDALDLPFEIAEDAATKPDATDQPVDDGKDEPKKSVTTKGLEPESVNDLHWKKFDRDFTPFEQAMKSTMRAYFKGQKNRVMAKFDALAGQIIPKNMKNVKVQGDEIGSIFDFDKEKELLARAAEPKIMDVYVSFGKRQANKMNPGIPYAINSSAAGVWVERKRLKLAQEVSLYTREKLSDAVVESVSDAVATGLSQSETIDLIKNRIDEIYSFANETRSENIATTEMLGSAHAGSFQAASDLGAERKTWITARDNRVRETHMEMEGKETGLKEPFMVGEGVRLQWPGDPSGPPEEICRCRCDCLFEGPK